MTNPAIYPGDIAAMSVSQLARLEPLQKHELKKNLLEASDFLKKQLAKLDAALEQAYSDKAKAALLESGRDFGTTHIADGPLRIKFDLPKKVTWDQKKLGDIAERVAASGDQVKSYIDIKLSVSESRYTNWPPALQQQFAGARTVEAGKPSFTLSVDLEVL
ncbi:MAG: hypothetical protein IPN53_14370 [Comamonadaceae bacterium]|nr:hypothetical protein [Comamonadaceae bacterium]